MIVLDTHIWIWWVQGDVKLTASHRELIQANESTGLGVPAISCWEVAKLAAAGRVSFDVPIGEWMATALAYPGVTLLPLTPEIAVDACNLPKPIHKDPADQLIIATARIHKCPLFTFDQKILDYPHVELV